MIREKLLDEIKQYCKLNNIDDVESLINKMLQQGFTIEKFGEKPNAGGAKEVGKKPEETKANKYKIQIKVEEEKIIEETIIIKKDKKPNTEKDLYGE